MTKIASSDWLSIRQASRLLGVHIGTVREWADSGLIPNYRTPGGHRRFFKTDLEKFLAQKRATHSTEQSLAHIRAELQAHLHADWLKTASFQFDERERARQREFGQRLLACVVRFIEEPHAYASLHKEGCAIARDYGRMLIANGISAGDAARATIYFRQLILKAVLAVHLGSRVGDEEDAQLFQRVSAFLDEILLAILEAYP